MPASEPAHVCHHTSQTVFSSNDPVVARLRVANHTTTDLRTEHMLEVTAQLLGCMGGSSALHILGCHESEVLDNATGGGSGGSSTSKKRMAHFTEKRFWFTVPFNTTAPGGPSADELKSSALAAGGGGALAPAAEPVRLSAFNHDGVTSPVSVQCSAPSGPLQKRVLFADDEPTIRKMAARFLDKLGCSSTLLQDGTDVLSTIDNASEPFDIVFLDIVMPLQSGEDACSLVRAKYPRLPIIAATANTSAQDQSRYMSVGFNGCLQKPYSINDVRAAIAEWTLTSCDQSSPSSSSSSAACETHTSVSSISATHPLSLHAAPANPNPNPSSLAASAQSSTDGSVEMDL